jgi:flagellar hook-length control protein FliK
MSIEFVGATANVASGVRADRANGQKAGNANEADDLNGFASVLSSVESREPVAEKTAGSADAGAQTDPTISEDERAKASAAQLPDPSLLLAQTVPNDVAMLLAQAAHTAVQKPPTSHALASGDTRQIGANGLAALSDAAKNGKTEVAGKIADALLAQGATDTSGATLPSKLAQLQAVAAANLADNKAFDRAAQMDMSARDPVLSAGLVASGMAEGFVRQADKEFGKNLSVTTTSGAEGAWGAQTLHGGHSVDAAAVIADPSMVSSEQMVADTVGYWVSQGIQNAELKLDGFGSDPVQVSISLKGGEAHIGFRTDQPEIRQILENATSQLKDLLSSEGLVLSGVTVGGSGSGGNAGSQERRDQQSARQATVLTKDVASPDARQRVNPSVGRALDLFV